MTGSKILIDERGGAELLDISVAKFRRTRARDPSFPKGRIFGGNTKYLVEELVAYAAALPKLRPGERGLQGEQNRKPAPPVAAEPEAA